MSSEISSTRIRDYWDQCTDLYLPHMTTFQAGLFAEPESTDPFVANAREIFRRADVKAGHRVLDLGCGICGPVIEMARENPSVYFTSVTNCKRQVEVAECFVRSAGLNDQIEVLFLDYHDISAVEGTFDRCLFLESFGYTLIPDILLLRVNEKLRNGGKLYIKDVCHWWKLTEIESAELRVFNETYCYNTPLLNDVRENANRAGFFNIAAKTITSEMYRAHSRRSMFVAPDNSDELTDFGRRHFKGFLNLPIDFYELIAEKPR